VRDLIEALQEALTRDIIARIKAGRLRKADTETTIGATIFRLMIQKKVKGKIKKREMGRMTLYDLQVA